MRVLRWPGGVLLAMTLTLLIGFCGCQGLPSNSTTKLNHVIVMVQENRSFDGYFGQLPAYWAANGYSPQPFDGLPQKASNPSWNGSGTIPAYHFATQCIEDLSPSWNESHLDWNLEDPVSSTAAMNGFVWNAANYAQNENAGGATPQYTDTSGIRAMGYYDGDDLNYYYFMASNFATSDRWFSPVLDRTQVNRLYLFAATSHGYAYPPGTDPADNAPLSVNTIFDLLNDAGISWKIYYSDDTCSTTQGNGDDPRSAGACTYLTQFSNYAPPNSLPIDVVPVSEYFTDVQAGTLPAVAFIESGYMTGRDEHPNPKTNVQTGAAYVASLINALIESPSWADSVFILTYDEGGGLYDHVPPQPAVSPDGIAPTDLPAGDVCTSGTGANCTFNYTGFRVPLIVISPFAKKNYVSHSVTDYTAILKLIETRFSLPSLTRRDAAQIDMTEFFDFTNPPWATPPTPPAQNTNGVCNPAALE